MVGGGIGCLYLGNVHRMAAGLDGMIELVCGAFSSDADRSRRSGEELGLDPSGCMAVLKKMIQSELALPADKRMNLVSTVTPNHMHFAPAVQALRAGFNVICDKPMTFDLEQAFALQGRGQKSGLIFALTHNYTGYPMVKQARHLVKCGDIGEIRKVVVEYPQGWLSTLLEASNKTSSLAYWSEQVRYCRRYGRYRHTCRKPGRIHHRPEDFITLCRHFNIGRGQKTGRRWKCITKIRKWCQRHPSCQSDLLLVRKTIWQSVSMETVAALSGDRWAQYPYGKVHWSAHQGLSHRGVGVCTAAQAHTRIPAGHPEGYLEAFANIYRM